MDTSKAEKLAQKMNNITSAFKDKIQDADDLLVSTDDFVQDTSDVIADICNSEGNYELPQVLNVQNMLNDIKYIRNTLKESSESGKKLLNSISSEIEFEPDPRLLMSYAEISKAINENMKLYIQCYKDMSSVILNMSKVMTQNQPKSVTNINIEAESTTQIKNTAELIKQLGQLKS